jgi:hypothetical protein
MNVKGLVSGPWPSARYQSVQRLQFDGIIGAGWVMHLEKRSMNEDWMNMVKQLTVKPHHFGAHYI